ncbi:MULTISPECIES: sugar isomerase domain-containing protein [Brachybacterium]|uniref:sugar isomerase domain-containing protein n=1 Tax=Brachybacterium TaxID=43668 RepID=UPI000DF13180|nr:MULTISPECIES: sugar isomerase domain-containing protein [Brachybacterium]RCS65524.1 sugar isomerase domain-containing protein [Brachybacterium sp. JB7]RCS71043.1 sugar isomerase domain-containing protein [Brachybacterium alimentarium]RCS71557.1 sugar isomerase domain-containing protein [Brachybacterium alimentarium]RCS75531.1 sugar isomerase domain-containing protein [Brachybacterium alimentarium]RCS78878.1 sugar isomerase domain-containing protein [Brachybacterium alimentarium]
MKSVEMYRRSVLELVARGAEETEDLERASRALARSLEGDGVLHVFGSGHSMLPAIDATFRAGGLAPVNLLHDPALAPWEPTRVSRIERLPGYGTAIAELHDLRRGEVLVIVSHSGINPVPVQLAEEARGLGLFVVAITSREHSQASRSRHPDGLRLLDVADVVLDTHAPEGDVTIALEDGTETGPTSTMLAALLLHSLVIATMEQLAATGARLPVLRSMNRADGDESNETVLAPFRERLSREP